MQLCEKHNKESVNLNRIASKFCNYRINNSVSKVIVGNDYYFYHELNIGYTNSITMDRTPLPINFTNTAELVK